MWSDSLILITVLCPSTALLHVDNHIMSGQIFCSVSYLCQSANQILHIIIFFGPQVALELTNRELVDIVATFMDSDHPK